MEDYQFEEMMDALHNISDQLTTMNDKLDDIKGYAEENSISDVCFKLDEVTSQLGNIAISLI